MKKKLLFLVFPIITVILELLPYGAICNFANPEGEPWRKTFSYFDPTPFGYANFAPLITAILTCVALVLLTVYCVTENMKLAKAARVVLCACALCSLCPLLLGIDYFSVVGGLISLSLFVEAFLLVFMLKPSDGE